MRKVRPTPTDTYLANPHKGCCTFQKFNGDALFDGVKWSEEGPTEFPHASIDVQPGYLPTTVSYCRWFWRVLEPTQGQYDFSVIDRALDICAQRGQTLTIRLMAYGSRLQPQVPQWYADEYPMADWLDPYGQVQRVPVHDAPAFLKLWGALITEAGRRFDGHPLLDTIDVAFVGPWGEGAGECSPETVEKFNAIYKAAFPKTHRLALIEGKQIKIGVRHGAGWRCDCFGDLACTGNAEVPKHLSWNHTFDAYPELLCNAGAQEVWRTAPIHLETCQVPMHWFKLNYDLDLILQQGLKYHATYFMPKSTRMPPEWLEKIAAFCRTLGYRYVYRQAVFDSQVAAGQPLRFRSWIENVGVAPIYRRYDFALRFRQGERQFISVLNDVDIRTWLPGDVYLDKEIPLPAGLKPGPVDLSVGLIDPISQQAKVRFAVRETYPDRWMPLGDFYFN